MSRSWRCAAILMFACVSLSAQQPKPAAPSPSADAAQPPTFRLAVNDVEVDVVVTDAQGQFLRGLNKNDFRLFEDGKPQDVSTLSLVDLPVVRTEQPPAGQPAPHGDVESNAQPFDGRLYVMVIDDLHTPPDQAQRIKLAARRFVEQDLNGNDVMAVLHTGGSQRADQAFTSDKALLLAAVDESSGRHLDSRASGPDGYSFDEMQAADARATLDTLRVVAGRLASVRHRRKTILFFSDGIDYDVRNLVPNDGGNALANVEPGARTVSNQWGEAVMSALRATVDAAMRANVAIYGIDPRGLAAPNDVADDSLRSLSEETGGIAVVQRNDFDAAYRRIVADNSSYYVLAYSRAEQHDGRFHKIDVRVNRAGVTVQARRGYLAPKSDARSAAASADDSASVRDVLDGPIPTSGLTIDLFAAPFKGAASDASVLVGTELRGRDLEMTGEDKVQLAYEAIDAAGRTFSGPTETITLNPKPETKARIERTGVRLLNRISLPPGQYQLRAAARDGSGRLGSVFSSVAVPDFSKSPLALSGIVLSSTTGSITPTARADDSLGGVLPAAPGALRTFPQTDTVAFYAEAYDNEAGAPHLVNLTARVADAGGRVLFNAADTRNSSELRVAGGRSGFTAHVPLKDLPVGSYALTMTAESLAGGVPPATRQLAFTVVAASRPMLPAAEATPAAAGRCCPNAAAYESYVRAFARGDRAAASIAIARASADDLKRAVSSINDRDPELLEAAAVMHLELTWRAIEAGNIEERHEQFRSSDTLFQKIRPSGNPAFVGAWYVAAVEVCLAAVEPTACAAVAQRGVSQKVASAQTHLAEGIVHETNADLEARRAAVNPPQNRELCRDCPGPRDYGNRIGDYAGNKQRAANLDGAERAYRQVLQSDPTAEEARLRLGRILSLKGKDAAARTELDSLVRDTHDSRISYLAHVFLANLAAGRRESDAAAREYLGRDRDEPFVADAVHRPQQPCVARWRR